MKETRADNAQALLLALALHVLLFGLMFAGLWWTRPPPVVSAAGAPVSAELIDASELSVAMRRTLAERPEPSIEEPVIEPPPPLPQPVEDDLAPPPQPLPEPLPQDAPEPQQRQPQELIPVPDTETREAVVEQPTPTPADEAKVREAKRRQEQVDLTERKRQEEVQRQQRLAKLEADRQKQIAEIRRRRAAATREAELAEQKLKQIADARALTSSERAAQADASASAAPGNNGTDTDLLARYQTALQQAILAKWTRPETVPVGARCRIVIRQLPGGEVMSAEVSEPCAYDELGRRSIEAAVLKAQPLPHAGFEKVFQRTLLLNFEARDR